MLSRTLGRRVVAGVVVAGAAMLVGAQTQVVYSDAGMMPMERLADSYAIYQALLPSNSIEWSEVKRTQWLLQDETTAKPLASACEGSEMTGLSSSVAAPAERQAAWNEVLSDYAAHCHDRYKLNAAEFKLDVPVRLLDKEAQGRYWQGVSGFMPPKNNIMQAPPTPDDFKGAAGLHSFSAVYFNRDHTLAATYFGMGCGSLCGNWTWVVLEKTPTGWRRLPWVHTFTMS
jgi:hypothetical protein